ncbi:MAG: hypothetical protein AAGA73_03335 [Pseudomonadota bacterium]
MRQGRLPAVLTVLLIAGCSSPATLKDMVGYVPPTSLPAEPKRTLVAEEKSLVWSQLVSLLDSSAFEVDLIDESKSLIVARYSGDPEPFIDCGSIVTHQNGTLGQIAGSAPTVALNYELEQEPVVLNRTLNLDSRIIIRLADQPQGTVIKTDTTYVVTKIVDVADESGNVRDGSRETISFEAGNRGEFSKGTACQPNGSLDLAVLKSLPKIVGSDEIDRAELQEVAAAPAEIERPSDDVVVPPPAEPSSADESPIPEDPAESTVRADADGGSPSVEELNDVSVPAPAPEVVTYDWLLPDQGLPDAAKPQSDQPRTDQNLSVDRPLAATPDRTSTDDAADPGSAVPVPQQTAELASEDATSSQASDDSSSTTIVDETTSKLLQSLDCAGEEWHFCDLVELTTPYRKRNLEQLFGLTVNTTESFTSQIIGSDLKLDILFPNFPSHLHIAYARRDGTIEHVLSSPDVWPADLAHQLNEAGKTIPGPAGLAMIVAIASELPLFTSLPDTSEEAAIYLNRLKQRLRELEAENPDGSVAASQLLIFVENGEA